MAKPIENSYYWSQMERRGYDGIADALIERFPTEFDTDPFRWNKRVLGVKVGNIDRQRELQWWRKHPRQFARLAELLNLSESDLVISEAPPRHYFSFPQFPALQPLDLSWESGCELGKVVRPHHHASRWGTDESDTVEAWVQRTLSRNATAEKRWLQIADATEFALAAARLEYKFPHAVIRFAELEAAGAQDRLRIGNKGPLALIVDEPMSPSAVLLLQHSLKNRKDAICIVSPYPGETTPGVEHWAWVYRQDWRTQLVEWIVQRAATQELDGCLQADLALKLLRHLDPGARLLLESGDLYAICHYLHLQPQTRVFERKFGKDAKLLVKGLLRLPTAGMKTFERLTEARWRYWDAPWPAPLPRATWAGILPQTMNGSALRDAGILVEAEYGDALSQPTAQRLLLRDSVAQQVRNGSRDWITASYDTSRRGIVDAALATLAFDELVLAAGRLAASDHAVDRFAPAVALFLALAPHLGEPERIQPRALATLQALFALVTVQIDAALPLPAPWIRPLASQAELLEWIAGCWCWSRLAPASHCQAPEAWLFPGSSEHPLCFPKPVLDATQGLEPGERQRAALETIYRLSDHFWEGMVAGAKIGEVPVFIRVCLLLHARRQRLALHGSLWNGVIATGWLERYMIEHADEEAALHWWPSLLDHTRERQRHRLGQWQFGVSAWFTDDPNHQAYSALLSWVLRTARRHADQAIAALQAEQVEFLLPQPESLPPELRQALLRRVQRTHEYRNALPFFFLSRFGRECGEQLSGFLDDAALGWSAAQLLWEWNAEVAESLLRTAGDHSAEAIRLLIATSPLHGVQPVLQALDARPDLLSAEEKRDWARKYIPYAGRHAAAMLPLATP